ncbi:MAG: ATPase [Prevotellaceae bacterium]|nr:ATPase [Prevotellaceae bacterium]
MTRLIADSGSTKTDWALIDNGVCVSRVQTCGFNPYMQSVDEMVSALLDTSLKLLSAKGVQGVCFYGAGCTPGEKSESVADALRAVFGNGCAVEVQSDMVGAARSLCGDGEGIACILGTGSNSCLWDGHAIVANVPPLGFILGDEGSGANLGKLLIGNVLKGQMPQEIADALLEELGMDTAAIIERVYRRPFPNRWLASLSPFIARHLHHEAVRQMVKEAFIAFFRRNVLNYGREDLPVGCVGSVAFHYQELLREAAGKLGLTIGSIAQSPMEGLITFHK